MTPRLVRVAAAVVVAAFFFVSSQATAQDDRGGNGQDDRRSLDLGVSGVGISIGDSRRWTGLRLNFRDSRLEEANGINATIWGPYKGGAGRVNGLPSGSRLPERAASPGSASGSLASASSVRSPGSASPASGWAAVVT